MDFNKNIELIGKFIYKQLYSLYINGGKNKKNSNVRKLIKFKELYPNSILSKYIKIEEITDNGIEKGINYKEIYNFYKDIYFCDYKTKIYYKKINEETLNKLMKLCKKMNIWKKTEIYNYKIKDEAISCIEKPFTYYKFSLFGSYYLQKDITKMKYIYIHKSNGSIIVNIKDIFIFWRNIYFNLYTFYDKQSLYDFKKCYKEFLYTNIIPLIIELIDINNDIDLIDKYVYIKGNDKCLKNVIIIVNGLDNINIERYDKFEPYCLRIQNEINNNRSDNVKYPKCFDIKEEDKLITFEFDLLRFL